MIQGCNKDIVECECEGALDRLKLLLSPTSPVIIAGDYRRIAVLRVQELEGPQELKDIGQ